MDSMFSRWKNGLARTSQVAFGRLAGLFGASEITEELWTELEALLVQADVGISTVSSILDSLRQSVHDKGLRRASEMNDLLIQELRARLGTSTVGDFESRPSVILLVGVNGSGKTTTVAKLGHLFSRKGLKVLLVAADTFRAAAVDQLLVWAGRLNLPVIAGQTGSDPGAVAYDAVQSAVAKGYDLVLIDTAGRLHTRYNLMEEIKKVQRVVAKSLPGSPHAVWLVLDATTGQNALPQARAFMDAVAVTGVILTKLDTSAKGGMAFAVRQELGLPILFAGLGEKAEDLVSFDTEMFIQGVLSG